MIDAALLDAENQLPLGQPPILTLGVTRLRTFLDLRLTTRTQPGYSMMGVVTGNAGVGKTIALQYYLESLTPRLDIGFPACVSIKIAPRSTPKAVASQLIVQLSGQRRRQNTYDLEAAAVEAIRRHTLDLILVDEGDWLTVESFELLRHLFDRSGCPIVVVGLPQIWQVITRHEKFTSRVGMHLDFLPPTRDELLTTILPQLVVPGWHFDPSCAADQAIGDLLWRQVGPSFRKLRVVLQCASQIMQAQHLPAITPDVVAQVLQLTQTPNWGRGSD